MAGKATDILTLFQSTGRKHKEGARIGSFLSLSSHGLEPTHMVSLGCKDAKKRSLYSGKSCVQLRLRTALFQEDGKKGYLR